MLKEKSRKVFFESSEKTQTLKVDKKIQVRNAIKIIGEWAVKLISSFFICVIASLAATIVLTAIQNDISISSALNIVIDKIRDWFVAFV